MLQAKRHTAESRESFREQARCRRAQHTEAPPGRARPGSSLSSTHSSQPQKPCALRLLERAGGHLGPCILNPLGCLSILPAACFALILPLNKKDDLATVLRFFSSSDVFSSLYHKCCFAPQLHSREHEGWVCRRKGKAVQQEPTDKLFPPWALSAGDMLSQAGEQKACSPGAASARRKGTGNFGGPQGCSLCSRCCTAGVSHLSAGPQTGSLPGQVL